MYKQIRNGHIVYCILRNLNDKSSLIIYQCPIKSTMKCHIITRHFCMNRFKTWCLVHMHLQTFTCWLTYKEYTQSVHWFAHTPLFVSPTKSSTISTLTNGYLNCIRLLTKKLLLSFRKTWSYKWTIHYIDDVFTLNNSKLYDYVDPLELEIKYITDITRSTS